jgi:hypothetical protein
VRFTIADAEGHRSAIEGVVPEAQFPTVYFTFDPSTGEQRISSDCVRLAQTTTTVRPRLTLPPGAQVHLAKGFKGVMKDIEVQRGVMTVSRESSSRTNCGYSLLKMDD